jgi:hypothetical protein
MDDLLSLGDDALSLDDGGLTMDGLDDSLLRLGLDRAGPENLPANSRFQDKALEPPRGAEYAQSEAKEEINEVLEAFRARARNENERFDAVNDAAFYFVVYFPSEAFKREFLARKGWDTSNGEVFLDGLRIAEHDGIVLETTMPPLDKTQRLDADFALLALGNGRPVTKRHIDDDA